MLPSPSISIPRPPPEVALSAVNESIVPSGKVKVSIGEKLTCSPDAGSNT